MDGEKVKTVKFSDEEKGNLAKLDFSEDFYNFYQNRYAGDTCNQGKRLNVRLAIEDFQASNDDGFALSYLMQMDFLNAVPVSPENPPINFTLDKSPADRDVQVGTSQTYSVSINNPGEA